MTASDIIGTAPDQTADLPMFAAQRLASPEVAKAEFRGAGAEARRIAREQHSHRTREDAYVTLATALEGVGPSTRKELASITAMPVNTVNARISEMRARTDALRVVTEGRRNGESVCLLARLRPEGP